MTQVLPTLLEPDPPAPALVTATLLDLLDAAERPHRRQPGLRRRHPGGHVALRAQLEVGANLLRHLAVEFSLAQEPADAAEGIHALDTPGARPCGLQGLFGVIRRLAKYPPS